MEKTVTDTSLLYRADDDTIYMITPITPIAGILGVTGVPESPKKDLRYIWKDSGVTKLILFIGDNEKDYISAARSAGFKQEGRLKKATPDGDLLVFGQYRKEN